MTEWVVRDATADDFEGWGAVFAEVAAEGRWIGAEAGVPIDRMRPWFDARVNDPQRLFIVADAGVVVGVLHADFVVPGVLELGMEITQPWRRRGLGSTLMERCISWARERGAHKLMLQVWPHNVAAIALYKKFGFAHEGRLVRHWRRLNSELWDLLVMALVLDGDAPGSPYADAAT